MHMSKSVTPLIWGVTLSLSKDDIACNIELSIAVHVRVCRSMLRIHTWFAYFVCAWRILVWCDLAYMKEVGIKDSFKLLLAHMHSSLTHWSIKHCCAFWQHSTLFRTNPLFVVAFKVRGSIPGAPNTIFRCRAESKTFYVLHQEIIAHW